VRHSQWNPFLSSRPLREFLSVCGSEFFVRAPPLPVCLLFRNHEDADTTSSPRPSDGFIWMRPVTSTRLPTLRWANCQDVIGVPCVGDMSPLFIDTAQTPPLTAEVYRNWFLIPISSHSRVVIPIPSGTYFHSHSYRIFESNSCSFPWKFPRRNNTQLMIKYKVMAVSHLTHFVSLLRFSLSLFVHHLQYHHCHFPSLSHCFIPG